MYCNRFRSSLELGYTNDLPDRTRGRNGLAGFPARAVTDWPRGVARSFRSPQCEASSSGAPRLALSRCRNRAFPLVASARARGCSRRWRNVYVRTWVPVDRNCDGTHKRLRPLLVPLTPCYAHPPPVSSTTFTLPSREQPSWSFPLPSGEQLYPPSLNHEVQDAHSSQAVQPHPAPAGWQADHCWFDSYGVVYVGLAPDVAVGESVPTVDICVVS